MYAFVTKVLVVAFAVLLTAELIPNISVDSLTTALLAALVLGILNAVVRPILVILTLPVTILTLGLFLLVINASLFAVAAYLLDGFVVTDFVAAFFGSLIVSLVSIILNRLIGAGK